MGGIDTGHVLELNSIVSAGPVLERLPPFDIDRCLPVLCRNLDGVIELDRHFGTSAKQQRDGMDRVVERPV